MVYEEPFTVEGSGTHRIRYRAIDFAGNISDEAETVIHLDQDPPDVGFDITGCAEYEGFFNCPVQITLDAEDYELTDGYPGSGVASIEYRFAGSEEWIIYTNPVLLNTSGNHSLQFRAIDKVGNIYESDLLALWLDLESPISSAAIQGEASPDGTYAPGATVEISALDPALADGEPGSGLVKIELSLDSQNNWITYTEPIILTETGLHTIYYRSVDLVGNVEDTHMIEIEIKIEAVSDIEPPISLATIHGEAAPDGTYAPGTSVEISAQDPALPDGEAGSGVSYIEFSLDTENNWLTYTEPIVLPEIGLYNIYYRSADVAGNVEDTQMIEIEIFSDIEPPLLELSADPLQLWSPNNKLVPVRIFGTVFDLGSGIQNIHIEVVDEYDECEPLVQDILPNEIIDGNWERTIELMASKKGNDKDGRKYTVIVTATDNLGNSATNEIEIIVPHDQS